jgi:NAD(P)H oxidase
VFSDIEMLLFPSPSQFVGQVVASEILMASESGCPIEMHKIKIEKCDEMYDRDCKGGRTMPFHRARYDLKTGQSPNMPREQVTYFSNNFVS